MIQHAEGSDAPVATPDRSARPLLITIAATLLLPMAFLIFAAARFDLGTSAQSTTESTQETTIETAKADSTVPPSVDLVEESVSLEHRRADAGPACGTSHGWNQEPIAGTPDPARRTRPAHGGGSAMRFRRFSTGAECLPHLPANRSEIRCDDGYDGLTEGKSESDDHGGSRAC